MSVGDALELEAKGDPSRRKGRESQWFISTLRRRWCRPCWPGAQEFLEGSTLLPSPHITHSSVSDSTAFCGDLLHAEGEKGGSR